MQRVMVFSLALELANQAAALAAMICYRAHLSEALDNACCLYKSGDDRGYHFHPIELEIIYVAWMGTRL